jgi:hypothetical protein
MRAGLRSGFAVSLFVAVTWSSAPAAGLSDASTTSLQGLSTIVGAGGESLAGVSQLTVQSIVSSGNGLALVLTGAAQGVSVVVRLSGETAAALGVAAGQVVAVSAETGGWVLRASGQVLGFVPDATGRALLYHAPRTGARPTWSGAS